MVDPQILKDYGSSNEAIKCLFTCEDPKKDEFKHRKDFEKRISARLFNGFTASLSNSHLYAASDLAWDAAPIVKENIPLLLYAQRKIKIDRCAEELDSLNCSSQFVRRNTDGTIKEIDLPRLYETSVNLVRSYITRRVAPQATKYSNLYPFFKYDPRTTEIVGKLRADALSQRVEIMTDQYNYRHLQVQVIRDMMLYGRSILFPACSWDREVQWMKAPRAEGLQSTDSDKYEIDAKVIREGVDFIRPHPSRVFWDMASPLATVNTNCGVQYVGFWNIAKYSDILNNTIYFNRDRVRISTTGRDFYAANRLYFDSQFNAQRIRFNTIADLRNSDPATANDLLAVAPYYQGAEVDQSLFVTEYYEKVIPNQVGLGKYPFPVWLRLVIASDDTVVFGEFMPTATPAIYFGFNENDTRAMNISVAHEIMPFQDQVSNLLSQLLMTAKNNALKIVTLDTDMVSDEIRTAVKSTLAADKYYVSPILLEYSGSKARNLGTNPQSPLTFVEKRASDDITTYFSSITQLLSIIERMMILSPQELGQAAPREISATEVNSISSSTTTVYNFISDSIDEGRAAWKKFIYESLINKATSIIQVPVVDRYPSHVIAAAGFQVTGSIDPMDSSHAQQQVMGTKEKLIHDYTFTARDGADRASNAQSAQTLVQLLGQVASIPSVLQAMGKDKLYSMINEVFRMSGAGFDLNLEVADGESNDFGPDDQQQQQQMQQGMQQIGQAVQKQSQQIQQQAQELQQTQQELESTQQELQKTQSDLQDVTAKLEQTQQDHLDLASRPTQAQQAPVYAPGANITQTTSAPSI